MSPAAAAGLYDDSGSASCGDEMELAGLESATARFPVVATAVVTGHWRPGISAREAIAT
jgi:hypothetical protein